MIDEPDRYDRQVRLPEVGAAGQDRIAAAHAVVRGREGAVVEAQYLCRAGVGALHLLPAEAPAPFRHAGWFRTDAARRVGAGAWRALRTIRGALGIEAP